MTTTSRLTAATAATLLLAGCQTFESYRYCSEVPPAQLSAVPAHLSATGLYADLGADALAPGVLPYRPEFELWSDGASKRRWIWLPPGTRIDTGSRWICCPPRRSAATRRPAGR